MPKSGLLSENKPQDALFEFGQNLRSIRDKLKTGSNKVLTDFENAQGHLSNSQGGQAKVIFNNYFTHDNQLDLVKLDISNVNTRTVTLSVLDAYLSFLCKIEDGKSQFLKGWKYLPTADEKRIDSIQLTLGSYGFQRQPAPVRIATSVVHAGYGALSG